MNTTESQLRLPRNRFTNPITGVFRFLLMNLRFCSTTGYPSDCTTVRAGRGQDGLFRDLPSRVSALLLSPRHLRTASSTPLFLGRAILRMR
jgi:hypothetical protein